MPFVSWVPASGGVTLPVSVANGGTGQVTASAALAALGSLGLVATTGATGTPYTLVNGTGNIISWTAPNDGNMHRVHIFSVMHVSVVEVGGQIQVAFTWPDGSGSPTATVYGSAQAVGYHGPSNNDFLVEANTTLTLQQSSALTSGTSVLWAELWAL